ncbi:three-helix bundle dimerization domain-containing protein [Nonomuraea sp. NPDC003709]|uniref:three-helix bundle dimerization domain-containing protein n=1 Tax=Nonomuraea sp. NPDC003709 TaxID=3154450 RepID=UPI0033B4F05C
MGLDEAFRGARPCRPRAALQASRLGGATMELSRPDALLRRIAQQLLPRFPGIFSIETVERYVIESYESLARGARIRQHLFTLTQRLAEERLTALAQSRGEIGKPVCEVLFVCTHNAGRSQMAAALMSHHAAGRVHVRTAGTPLLMRSSPPWSRRLLS